MNLTQEELHQLFEYSPATGKLTWRNRELNQFPTERSWKVWNKRYAGKQVGRVIHDQYGNSYTQMRVGRKDYSSSRIIWTWMTGEAPPKNISRIDGNSLNLAWANLCARRGTPSKYRRYLA